MRNTNSKIFLLILLGSLTAFGPLVTDMYLPSLPSMTDYFGTQASMVQLGLTSSMIGLALRQLFFGPLSDWYGRRPPLLVAMSLFIVSTVCCIFSATIEGFIFFRLIQGIAGAGGIVVSRSIATDRFTGKELAKSYGDYRGYQWNRTCGISCIGRIPNRLYRLEGYFYRTVDSRSFVTVLQFTFQGVFIGG